MFDSDVIVKEAVRMQLDALSNWLTSRGAYVLHVLLPHTADEKVGVDDFLAAGHDVDELLDHAVEYHVAAPLPLSRVTDLPPFPVHALPETVAKHVEALAHFTQTPADVAGTVALGVLAAAAGGGAVIEVRDGWSEPVNLFTVVASPPGTRKSARVSSPL